MSKPKRITQALAVAGAGLALAVSAGATGAHAATATAAGAPSASAAAACVSLVGTYSDGFSKYGTVRNICSGTYSFYFVINNWPDTGCFSIGGNQTKSYRTGGIASPAAARTAYC
ncbi:hypothetical protein [Actinoplanes sp. TFC3]|uniref:hypothetical protein n=1 Tax=Actinoplanes sp. TFC3 TaxID=1710355 RepID=UPI00082E2420|nr:hypothetical protein [Actinoplanes sp. TFC3]